MKIKLSLVCFLILSWICVRSQKLVSGHIIDTDAKPLLFVSILLLKDSNIIAGTSTDKEGDFQLLHNYRAGELYSLKVSLTGYQSFSKNFIYPDTLFAAHIILSADKQTLGEVTVSSKKPLLTRKADRYIINVENSFLSDGNSGLEVLQKSPGIWVDNNGSIRIKGNQPVTVMINEVMMRMPQAELSDYLKTLRSEDISKIEVIQNPPSEFEAAGSGGIIHIILKRSRKDGLNGSVNGQYRQQGKKFNVNAGGSLNYKIKNIYLSGGYSATKDERYTFEKADIIYPDKSRYHNHTDRDEDMNFQQYRVGIIYELGGNQTLGIQTARSFNRLQQFFISDIDYTGSQSSTGVVRTNKLRDFKYGGTTFNYSWKLDSAGSALKIIADYTNSNRKLLNDFFETYNDPNQNSTYKNSNPFSTDIYSIQADYNKILKNMVEIKGGTKFSRIERDNTLLGEKYSVGNWIYDSTQSNRFNYKEDLFMFYSSIEKRIKRTIIKTGLRAEETFSNGKTVNSSQQFSRKYFGLFPSLFIMYHLNEEKGNAIFLNYSRRLTRPGLADLNPYRLQFNNYTSLTGNPRLLPQYTHNLKLGCNLLNDYSADVYVTRTDHVISLSANPGSNNSIDYKSENVNSSMEYGFSLSAPFKIWKVWTSNNNFSLQHLSYSFNNVDINQTSFSAKSVNTVTLKKLVDIDAVADYRSPYMYANLRNAHVFYFDMGFSRKILRGQGNVRLSVSDIFNTIREKELTEYNQTIIEFYRKRLTRILGLSFSYNFSSGKKFSNNKIELGSSEEKGRIGN